MSRNLKTAFLIFCDLICILIASILAFLIRFDFVIPVKFFGTFARTLPFLIPIRIGSYYIFGLYNRLWQYASVREIWIIVKAGTIASLGDWLFLHSLQKTGFPRSITLLIWLLNIILVGGIRFLIRFRHEFAPKGLTGGTGGSTNGSNGGSKIWLRGLRGPHRLRTLIIGAGQAGNIVARELRSHRELPYEAVGFIDDDPSKQGYRIADLPVLGTHRDLPRIIRSHNVREVIIAMPSAPGSVVKEIVEICKGQGVNLKTLPGMYELINGKVSVRAIRDVQIEDLLRRDEIRVDLKSIAGYLCGERVLVTGAGGSIGSELSRQIARFNPAELILLGHGENSIYEIEMEFRATRPDVRIAPVIADIRDQDKIDKVFSRFRPDVVFHAAAHKHVPLMEANPDEAMTNNIFGTWNVASAADRYGAKRFVLISTDKAVNPTSVMGCTKRAAEIVIQMLNRTSKTKFVAVRFGNVLGSRGSVVPLFKKQIALGGPVTVTHPDMMRYFMTIPEAVQLVIQAAAMGEGGEIFVLDMGQPVRILDMARDLIRLSGFEPDRDIKIEFVGVRPGEKLFEELLTAAEGTVATRHKRIFIAKGNPAFDGTLEEFFETCRQIATAGAGEGAGDALVSWIRQLTDAGTNWANGDFRAGTSGTPRGNGNPGASSQGRSGR
ncbi:MAG: polysaccharide biosynthesis protein [Firmicutes bacterium]|nr:polysaccharide biosynthesis protein [Bacillota bacterium]